ncbi:MAG TPA: response regulator, partial [Rhodospirillales bacterium]|nr:response regulator [Rhodospirillales bacterium]
NFKNTRLTLGLMDDEVRSAVRPSMDAAGFEPITEVKSIAPIAKAANENSVDLLICDVNLEDGRVCGLIRKIRHHEIGGNPFIEIIVVIDAPTPKTIKEIIDSGVDDLVITPISGAQLLLRIHSLSLRKRKYVVTVDYIGPDRRKKDRPDTPGEQKIPLIDVPNILMSKALGGDEAGNLSRNIENAMKIITEQKIERGAYQIEWLAERIAASVETGENLEDAARRMTRLSLVTEDIQKRMTDSRYDHAKEFCGKMKELAEKIAKTLDNPDLRDARYLEKLSQSINKSILKTK